jgi:peptidoglycan lytic transglycosylase
MSDSPLSSASKPKGRAPMRRRRPWLLLALGGVLGMRALDAMSDPREGAADADDDTSMRHASRGSTLRTDLELPFTTATLASQAWALPELRASVVTPLARDDRPEPVLGTPAKLVSDLLGGGATDRFELTARPVDPGRTWQDAANVSDWPAVAMLIDALPESEQSEPGARYARAVAARELGQCRLALSTLEGLDQQLSILATEIASLRAHCQLEVGPFEAAYEHFSRTQTAESLTLAARAAIKAGDFNRAEQALERALSKVRQQDGKRGLAKEVAARALRANLLEARGQPKRAARDWLWLATQAPTDELGATADETYERLAESKLGSLERLERMRAFAREGQVERTLRESARLATAPGPVPPRVDTVSSLAWAYYHSRTDYRRAALLFREAAALSPETRPKFDFFTARAQSRAGEDDAALETYRELVRRYPGGAYTEQAYYRIARIEYERGHWEDAERAFLDYLERYGRNGGGKYAGSSRYELAITRLGTQQRTREAAATFALYARKERRAERRAMLTHLEAVALETTREPAAIAEAVERYRSVIEELPLSFAAMASTARLKALGVSPPERTLTLSAPLNQGAINDARPLPEKARFLADLGLHTDAERALFDERQAARALGMAADGQAACEMYGALDRGYRSYATAQRLLKSDDLGRLPSSNNFWAWRCTYPEPYRDIVGAVESRYRLPRSLVHAVMRQESAFRPAVVSPVGAVGLMQLMPNTARRAAEEISAQPGAPWVPDPSQPTNVVNNIELGGFYLGKLLGMLGSQMPVAVAAYNAGPTAVSGWLAGGEDLPIDVWVGRIPYAETRDYVAFVLGNWLAYRYLDNPTELPELRLAMIPGVRAAPDAY